MTVRSEFAVHMLNEVGIARANQLGEGFSTLLDTIESVANVNDGGMLGQSAPVANQRELALARTKLQEASFWAKRAMALNPANQKG